MRCLELQLVFYRYQPIQKTLLPLPHAEDKPEVTTATPDKLGQTTAIYFHYGRFLDTTAAS